MRTPFFLAICLDLFGMNGPSSFQMYIMVKHIILFIITLIKKMISGHVASLICFICPSQIKGDKRVEETQN
jgi:hypothetical protein